ncbi:MAG: respiratory nitrate reductase subunit gamma [Anaerolineae bacterium]|jgi:nitrate reductase gamma subunit|nr:respiratory nitrate reductase subunit gamma [Anaerolineae bacterium]MBT4309198.1 respiratory nitrate reductase subunit gamma [Anaerolineae bacterium]MBT4458968.1 respiratory nitrate reductase subunit gamma [Anaerolineae bacterium]MBT4843506.1 respiratory nitrate reductase subunit gamma [Anaerolineae bacterium]MBT6059885.1 respiratory nitrate reductase subunit gamma [Anaerolineae bacterium]
MDWNQLLFVVFPYVSITLFIAVTIYRVKYRPFTISSLSSQLLEGKQLYWGSIPFHHGILWILLFHLIALLTPKALLLWNAVPIRLYLLEISGFILGLWALGGVVLLFWRRMTVAYIKAVTTPMDIVVLLLTLVSILTGVLTAALYRFGSVWFTGVFTPYLWSILTLQPRPELVAPLPWLVQLHLFNNFALLALLPFSRLVHILSWPLDYLVRPWQIVIGMVSRKATK